MAMRIWLIDYMPCAMWFHRTRQCTPFQAILPLVVCDVVLSNLVLQFYCVEIMFYDFFYNLFIHFLNAWISFVWLLPSKLENLPSRLELYLSNKRSLANLHHSRENFKVARNPSTTWELRSCRRKNFTLTTTWAFKSRISMEFTPSLRGCSNVAYWWTLTPPPKKYANPVYHFWRMHSLC